MILRQFLAAVLLAGLSSPAAAEIHYVSPAGSPEGEGTPASPLNLATALSVKTSPAEPGDTIALGGGTYRGMFKCNLGGTEKRPIVIRGIPGQRVTIDGGGFKRAAVTVGGQWTIWRDLELTNSDPRRNSRRKTDWPADLQRRAGMRVTGQHIRLRNLVVHDAGDGLELYSRAEDAEVYGCISYYNGWDSPTGGHGHGIDVQNARGTKRIVDNILFNNFACGLHAASRMAPVRGLHIEGNILFDNGVLAHAQRQRNMLIGSLSLPVERIVVKDNFLRHTGNAATSVQIGRQRKNADLVFTGNYIVGASHFFNFRSIDAKDNTFVSTVTMVHLHMPKKLDFSAYTWRRNNYFFVEGAWYPLAYYKDQQGAGIEYADWCKTTKLDIGSQFNLNLPTGVEVVVRRNRYEQGRGHIVVYNWDRKGEVQVDLSGVLKAGQKFQIVSARNFFGAPVVEGTWGDEQTTVTLPMAGPEPVDVVGKPANPAPPTDVGFGCFVVLPVLEFEAAVPAELQRVEPPQEDQ